MREIPFSMANFYPNECFTCCQTSLQGPLKRCSRCRMIAYCGEKHQRSNWPMHKDLCNAINETLKERGWTHVFENLKDHDSKSWINERKNMLAQAQVRVSRKLLPCEQEMFLFPRACFVCHENRQGMLTDCPRCPGASFCREHESSPLHDPYCHLIAQCHDLDRSLKNSKWSPEELIALALDFVGGTPIFNKGIDKDLKLPTSMEEYLDIFVKPQTKVLPDYKIHVSEHFTKVLTLYNALQKINYTPSYELTIYVGGLVRLIDVSKFWEILLHLLPDVTLLRIVSMDQEKTCIEGAKLCADCEANNKLLFVENINYGYPEMLNYKTKPSLVIFFNVDPLDEEKWTGRDKLWGKINSPLAVATANTQNGRTVSQTLRETFGSEKIFVHDGENEFLSLRPRRQWKDESAFLQNQYLIVSKSKEEINGETKSIPESSMAKLLRNK